jgi:hypothetical protein
MSLTKRVRAFFKPGTGKHKAYKPDPNQKIIQAIWPDGTWNMAWPRSTNAEMDLVTQAYLEDAWQVEHRAVIEQTLGREVSPDMLGQALMPDDWTPSMAALKKAVSGSDSVRFVAYVGARLESLGRLRS